MTNEKIEEKKKRLADSVGDFIRYWGFKEVHGRIWVHIYLSDNPITAKELTKKLGVTKGLVSTALAELIAYQVVEKVNVAGMRASKQEMNQKNNHSNLLADNFLYFYCKSIVFFHRQGFKQTQLSNKNIDGAIRFGRQVNNITGFQI